MLRKSFMEKAVFLKKKKATPDSHERLYSHSRRIFAQFEKPLMCISADGNSFVGWLLLLLLD